MYLVISSGAARPQAKSNTAKIIAAFQKGYEESGNTTEIYYFSDRRQWAEAQKAFQENTNILIALPLYVEDIPGILLEFLTGLQPKKIPGTKLSFLLQGGFPQASQSLCCETFLETLPSQLGCEYAGTLIKGDMFGAGLVDEKSRKKTLATFTEVGRVFARSGQFEKSAVDAFAVPEYMPEKQKRMYNLFGRHISRFFMGHSVTLINCYYLGAGKAVGDRNDENGATNLLTEAKGNLGLQDGSYTVTLPLDNKENTTANTQLRADNKGDKSQKLGAGFRTVYYFVANGDEIVPTVDGDNELTFENDQDEITFRVFKITQNGLTENGYTGNTTEYTIHIFGECQNRKYVL